MRLRTPRILYLQNGKMSSESQKNHDWGIFFLRKGEPPKEVEPLADEQEWLVTSEERLPGSRDILIGRIPSG